MNFLDENGFGRLWAQIILKLNSKVPDGGITGQVLKKTETGTEWADAPQTVTTQSYTATLLSTNWAEDGGYKKQTVTVTGLKTSYPVHPTYDVQLSGTNATNDQAILDAFAKVSLVRTEVDQLVVYCIGNAPETDIPLLINTWG